MLKIGDRVTIRSGLIDGIMYGVEMFVEGMESYGDEIAQIVGEGTIYGSWELDLDDRQYAWTEEMFDMEKTIRSIPFSAEPITDWQEAFQDIVMMLRLTLKDNFMVDEIRDQIITKRTK